MNLIYLFPDVILKMIVGKQHQAGENCQDGGGSE